MKERYTHIGRSVAVGLAALVMNISAVFGDHKWTVSDTQPLVLAQSSRATQIQSIQMYPKLSVTAPPEHFEQAKKTLDSVMNYLIQDFGPAPAEIGNLTVIFKDVIGGDLHITQYPNGSRSTTVDPIYLREDQAHTITHEVFHGLYQTDRMLDSLPLAELEKWATYAEYRYKYHGQDNLQIAQKLKEDFDMSTPEKRNMAASRELRDGISGSERQIISAALALQLFEKPHQQNYVTYRNMLRANVPKIP